MKTEHTPGPWKTLPCPDFGGRHPLQNHRYVVTEDAEVEYGHDPRPGNWVLSSGTVICAMRDQRSQANDARLIAAAPELLAACKALVAISRKGLDNPDDWSDMDDLTFEIDLQNAEAALAKATGE